MRRSSTSITLALITSTLAAIGFEGCRQKPDESNNPDTYFTDYDPASTQPYRRNDPYYYNHHYYGMSSWNGSSSTGGGSSSSSSSHTSRGGFGSSGHGAHS
ncbi:MAG: hypothetical protein JWL69_3925 [Phycisphaerales bacterium]|nr:hypothetical protein [Phycisphaerales bacterium]MDB5357283.1 hypothetical protein [Phycisphaerales bacterium]